MPKYSERQQCERFIEQGLMLTILDESCNSSRSNQSSSHDTIGFNSDLDTSSDSTGESEMKVNGPQHWIELSIMLDASRYLCRGRHLLKTHETAKYNFHKLLPTTHFRSCFWMNPSSFWKLHDIIEPHSIFHNNSTCSQIAPCLQLGLFLERLGHDGNAVSFTKTLMTYGVSTGSVHNYTMRCMVAVEETLKDAVKWPKLQERREIAAHFAKTGFLGCVGLIDGTLFPLSQRPGIDGECYWDRKQRYSLNAQIVCDHKRRIRYLNAGED